MSQLNGSKGTSNVNVEQCLILKAFSNSHVRNYPCTFVSTATIAILYMYRCSGKNLLWKLLKSYDVEWDASCQPSSGV